MDFELRSDECGYLEEVRAIIRRESTPELLAETRAMGDIYGGAEGRKIIQKIGARGLLASNWPKRYGGLGTSDFAAYAIRNELAYAGLPWIFVGASVAGPTILRFGNDELKGKWLPPIARGECEFALGYTEPQAGSDLSSISMRAEEKGDHFLLNGQKIFNTHCHVADFHWVAARTDPKAPRHKGLSFFIVDLTTPGITIRPLITMAGTRTNVVYYDDVVVPGNNLVGEKNKGFYHLMTALDFERMVPPGMYRKHFENLVQYAKETVAGDRPLSKNPIVRQKLAQLATELEVAELLYYQLPHFLEKDRVPSCQSAMEKLFVTELSQRISNAGMEILGLFGTLKKGSKWAPLDGAVEHHYRASVVETIYGGTSEIQRNIMAIRGLEMPTA